MAKLTKVCSLGEIPVGSCQRVTVGSATIAVFRTEVNEVYAVKDTCPHAEVSLSTGSVNAGVVTCPGHVWRFRLSDGKCMFGDPDVSLMTYPVKVVGTDVFLAV